MFRRRFNFKGHFRNIIKNIQADNPIVSDTIYGSLPVGVRSGVTLNLDTKSAQWFVDKNVQLNDIDDFVSVAVTLFHEEKHMQQYENMLDGSCPGDILCSQLAAYGNHDYYIANYKCDVSEIDAEHYGVIQTYAYLSNYFSPDDSFSWIMSYVNSMSDTSLYLLVDLTKVNSIADLDCAFDDAYDKAQHRYGFYFIDRSSDDCAVYMQNNRNVKESFLNLETKFEKDRLLTAIHMRLHPDHKYIVDNNPNVDISEFDEMFPHRDYPYNSKTTEDSDDFHL